MRKQEISFAPRC